MIKITNDTSTLRGSLTECKDQLISELANQGVTATYDPTTGLLGLIHKISEITPTTPSLTLTTNKNILSYYDSETATLTATHSQGAGKTVEIYNAVSGAKIGDATDNNDGTYTYTYNSAGIGDISMTAVSGNLESDSILIEDCLYFDTQTTDKQRYTVTTGSATLTYTTDGLQVEGTQSTDTLVQNNALTLPTSYTLECTINDFAGDGNPNNYGGLCFDNLLTDFQSTTIKYYKLSPITSLGDTAHTFTRGDTIKIEMNNGTAKVYVNNDLKNTLNNISHTGVYQHRTYWRGGGYTKRLLTIKDLKVKPLTTQ